MKLNLTETIDDVWNVSSLMLYPHPNDSNKRKDWVEQSKYHNLKNNYPFMTWGLIIFSGQQASCHPKR